MALTLSEDDTNLALLIEERYSLKAFSGFCDKVMHPVVFMAGAQTAAIAHYFCNHQLAEDIRETVDQSINELHTALHQVAAKHGRVKDSHT